MSGWSQRTGFKCFRCHKRFVMRHALEKWAGHLHCHDCINKMIAEKKAESQENKEKEV